MIQLADPATREPLTAFQPYDPGVKWGPIVWQDGHDPDFPSWQRGYQAHIGFEYIRQCQRPCHAKAGRP